MARKIIPYPCDYKATASVRRARRGGNVFVIILCIFIALLMGAGAFFALANDRQALKALDSLCDNAHNSRNTNETPIPQQDKDSAALTEQPAATPKAIATPAPTATEQPTEIPELTPIPTPTFDSSVFAPPMTPAPSPDPTYAERMAKSFTAESIQSIPDVVDACMPGVVGILNYQYTSFKHDLKAAASGSGFVITSDGYIVTNEHVIADAHKITVILTDNVEVEARLIGSDIMSDVAVLKIDSPDLTPLPIGNSDTLRAGQTVLAIGNPLSTEELYGTVTSGIISALAREINIDGFTNEMLQTDAAINPGNSGGPLLNMNGEVIGVTNAKYFTAGYDENGNALHTEGIGFAIPIKNVMTVVDALIRNGAIPRPGIGIKITMRTAEDAILEQKPEGVYIASVTPGGPADEAGLKINDILLALDGVSMTTDEYVQTIRAKQLGDQITFTVLRNGETLEIVVTVGDLNQMH